MRSIELPETCTSIGYEAFSNGTALTSVDMPNVTSIGDYAFYYCYALTSVSMPNVTSIGDWAFYKCTSLTSVSMPSVVSIGSITFQNCYDLTSLTIPSTCTSIGSNPFQCGWRGSGCTFTFEGTTPPTIESNTFDVNYINKIIVPAGCGEAYKTATNWTTFADYIEEATE